MPVVSLKIFSKCCHMSNGLCCARTFETDSLTILGIFSPMSMFSLINDIVPAKKLPSSASKEFKIHIMFIYVVFM
ncbi:hypothetical protein Patl1_27864 [Pistacia atlantica]|uniref:Uncharacterized protein n=1 Tax=Pistacia atlantica TaxID=434234 RepID=A0ACC1BD72_9ROSI|nr:hypothetical protein Patl1_27864 [Pistacia atlantica]